ncbi:MAG: hypothetical protein OEZ33_10955 [Gammaproteobacteria bacterium]|nr:hypothetical protein [Gammaproteobacteria bacterium]MDH5778721.1 hypothetical protein [Gammaproteobacteria bacterium]
MSLNFSNQAVSLKVRLSEQVIDRHIPASPYIVGEELARQINDYVREHELGYYPAIDFFIENGGIEKDLLDAASNISWVITSMVREEITTRLRPVFASLKFDSLLTTAFTIPPVRPGQNNAYQRLVEHYTPDQVKINLTATLLQKESNTQDMEQLTRHLVCRWLKNRFEELEITAVQTV